MVIVLTGPDTFRSRERLRQLREAFLKKYDPSGMNVTLLDGASLKFETFEQSVASQGFLSSRRFVVVEDPLASDAKTQEAVATYLENGQIPEETIVVFRLGGVPTPKRGKKSETGTLNRALTSVQHVERFDPLESSETERWIRNRAKELGGSIEPAAAVHLAAAAGSDLWLIENELTKLVYGNQGVITLKHATDSIAVTSEENIFAFTDALSRKDRRTALALLEQQLESGANELYLLTMLLRQFRILLTVADIASAEPNPATIASRLQLHPFVAKKALQQIRAFSQSELVELFDRLVVIEQKLKSTRENPRALLELFVIQACRG